PMMPMIWPRSMRAFTPRRTTFCWYATVRSRMTKSPFVRSLTPSSTTASIGVVAMPTPLLQRIRDLPGVREPHALHGLRATPGRTERIAIEIRDDLHAGFLGQRLGQLGIDVRFREN